MSSAIRVTAFALAASLCAGPGAFGTGIRSGGRPSRALLILGATLVDGTGAPPVPDSYVMVQNGRFEDVATASERRGRMTLSRNVQVVDGTGLWIVPGFVDARAHVSGRADARAMLRWGVTSARVMKEDAASALKVAARSRRSRRSPDLYPSAPIFTIHGGWWSLEPPDTRIDRFPTTAAAARRAVDRARELGVAEVAVVDDDMRWCRDPLAPLSQISPEVVAAIAGEARSASLRVAVDTARRADALRAVADGATILARGLIDGSLSPEDVETCRRAGAFYVPTLAYFDLLSAPREFLAGALRDRRIAQSLSKKTRATLGAPAYAASFRRRCPNEAFLAGHRATLAENLKAMHAGGVPVAAGSDLPALPGAGLHLELAALVRAGFTPLEAIRAATLAAAQSLGIDSEAGTIAPGKKADFVLLENDPTVDIRNTRSIDRVYKGGRLVWTRYRSGSVE